MYQLGDIIISPEFEAILRANPELRGHKDEDGCTLLHYAAHSGSFELCRLLIHIDWGLVSTADNSGWLPIHYACSGSYAETAKYLFDNYPGSINAKTANDYYPLQLLLHYNHDEESSTVDLDLLSSRTSRF